MNRSFAWPYTATVLGAFALVLHAVPNAYMDEIFHIPQTQAFCQRRWEWNPDITTLPGSYLVAMVVSAVLGLECSTALLRTVNVLVLVLVLPHVLQRLTAKRASISLLQPVLVFCGMLFYTDVLSTAWTLATWSLVRRPSSHWPQLCILVCASMAVFTRQTNVVWLLFVSADDLISRSTHKNSLLGFVRFVWHDLCSLLWSQRALAFVVLCFAAFVQWNGAIVIGHHEHHRVSFVPVQMLYCAAAFAAFNLPLVMFEMRNVCVDLCRRRTRGRTVSAFAALTVTCAAAAKASTEPFHPFVLSDSRHYTSVLVRHIFLRASPFIRPANLHALFAPVYAWLFLALHRLVRRTLLLALRCEAKRLL
ncbi:MAG: hypothetical protein MHM6MM_003120 [Cercozoa sp. M6MM]